MRQILIEKTKLIKDISFNTAKVTLNDDILLRPGLNIVKIPFDVKPLHGDNINFKFELTEAAGYQHLLLVGAYYEQELGEIKAMLYNLSDTAVTVSSETPVLLAVAFEQVMLRQIEAAVPDPVPPKRTKKTRK